MSRQDHLIRRLEEVEIALARIRELIASGRAAQGRAELRLVSRQLGVDLSILERLAPESILQNLIGGGGANLERMLPAAEVLLVKGELEAALGEARSAQSFARAALLARQVRAQLGEGGNPLVRSRVDKLLERAGAAAG